MSQVKKRPYRCWCSSCHREHALFLEPHEFKMLIVLPGAMAPAGFLKIACDTCRPTNSLFK